LPIDLDGAVEGGALERRPGLGPDRIDRRTRTGSIAPARIASFEEHPPDLDLRFQAFLAHHRADLRGQLCDHRHVHDVGALRPTLQARQPR